jgi:hypothetical protein
VELCTNSVQNYKLERGQTGRSTLRRRRFAMDCSATEEEKEEEEEE